MPPTNHFALRRLPVEDLLPGPLPRTSSRAKSAQNFSKFRSARRYTRAFAHVGLSARTPSGAGTRASRWSRASIVLLLSAGMSSPVREATRSDLIADERRRHAAGGLTSSERSRAKREDRDRRLPPSRTGGGRRRISARGDSPPRAHVEHLAGHLRVLARDASRHEDSPPPGVRRSGGDRRLRGRSSDPAPPDGRARSAVRRLRGLLDGTVHRHGVPCASVAPRAPDRDASRRPAKWRRSARAWPRRSPTSTGSTSSIWTSNRATSCSGETGEAVLIDFGTSRHRDLPDLLAEELKTPIGTGPYISPEQILRIRDDPRSDLFALGVSLYLLSTGRRPFGNPTTVRGLRRRFYRDPPPPGCPTRTIRPGCRRSSFAVSRWIPRLALRARTTWRRRFGTRSGFL